MSAEQEKISSMSRDELERELASLRAATLSLEPIEPEHREPIAHMLSEMLGWSAERASLAKHERQAFETTHWMETYRWLSALLGTLPGRHLVTWRADAATTRPCWCPIGEDHATGGA